MAGGSAKGEVAQTVGKNACESVSETLHSGKARGVARGIMLRRFLVVLSVGLSAMAVVACGGGNGGDENPVPSTTGESANQGDSTPSVTPATFGMVLVLEADIAASPDVDLDDIMQQSTEVIKRRAETFGIGPGVAVERQDGNRLAVRLPGVEPSATVDEIRRTGLLEFRELQLDADGKVAVYQNGQIVFVWMPQRQIGSDALDDQRYQQMLENAIWVAARAVGSDGLEKELTGRYLADAHLGSDLADLPTVDFQLDDEGAYLLEQISTRMIGKPLAFFLDGEPIRNEEGKIFAPIVQAVIKEKAQIMGLPIENAEYLAKILSSGSLPVPFRIVEQQQYGQE